MEFLQLFLRRHFVGKPYSGGVALCRLLFHAKCNFIGTIESVCMLKKRLWHPGSWTSTGFVWKTNTSAVWFIVCEHQNGRRDGIWKHLHFSVLIVYLSCLAPWPHYSARLKRFGSRGPSKDVSLPPGWEFPFPSPRIRHWRELSERDWENAAQGRGNSLRLFSSLRSIACVAGGIVWVRDFNRSRVPKKGNRDEAVEIPPARKPRYFE